MEEKCSIEVLCKIAKFLPKWRFVARLFRLDEQIIRDIEEKYPQQEDQRMEMLVKWVNMQGNMASCKKIYDALLELEEKEAAEKISSIFGMHMICCVLVLVCVFENIRAIKG